MNLVHWLHDLFRPPHAPAAPESPALPEREHPGARAAEQALLEQAGAHAQARLDRLETIARARARRLMKTRS